MDIAALLRIARRGTLASLDVREYRILWTGLLVLFTGSQIRMVASGYLAYELTRSPLLLGIVTMGFAVPMLTLSLTAGVIADRFDRRRLVQLSQGFFVGSALFVAISVQTGVVTWVHLLLASAMQGALWAILVPSRQAMIPGIVGRRLMTNALVLSSAAYSMTTLLGPAVGGALYSLLGPAGTYYTVAALGLIAMVQTGRLQATRATAPTTRHTSGIREGLAYIRRQPSLLMLLALSVLYAMVAMPFRMILPVFVVDLYGMGPEALGLMVSAMGVGSIAASMMVANAVPGRRGLILLAGGQVAGAAILVVAGFPVFWVGLIGMLLLGIGDAMSKTLNQAMLLEIADEEFHGRVTSVYMISFGLMPLGALPASALAEAFGGRVAGAVMGTILLAASLAFLANRCLRRMS